MASFTSIPPVYVQGFADMFHLTEDEFKNLIDRLELTSLTSSIRKLANTITDNPSKNDTIRDIFLSVGSLTIFIEKGMSIEEIAENVYYSFLSQIDNEMVDIADFDSEPGKHIFTSRIITLLKTERLYYAAKSNDLMGEYQNVFIEARTITDIRPVFNLNLEDNPKASLIIHNLHIHYSREHEGAHQDIYLAMDSNDLKILKELILRAEKKENSLRSFINNSGMINLNE